MQRYVVTVETPNTWCFDHGLTGHTETSFVVAHDAQQAIMLIAHQRQLEAYDKDEVYSAYLLAEPAKRFRKQQHHPATPAETMVIGPDSFCLCKEMAAKGVKGSCRIHK